MGDIKEAAADLVVNSSPINKLSVKLLGVDFAENPGRVVGKMIADRKKILQNYGLPLSEAYTDKREYARELMEIAESRGVRVRYVDKKKLENAGLGGGIKSDGTLVVPRIDLSDESQGGALNWSVRYAHELIHAFQMVKSPDMPIENMEYESYVATYLPTAVSLVATDHRGEEWSDLHDRLVAESILKLVRDSSIGYYEKVGQDLLTVDWVN